MKSKNAKVTWYGVEKNQNLKGLDAGLGKAKVFAFTGARDIAPFYEYSDAFREQLNQMRKNAFHG